jgi:Domain of unknown function (DUF4129)
MSPVLLSPTPPDAPPLDPTAEHARQQLLQELSKSTYQSGRPTGTSLFADFLSNLFNKFLTWIDSLLGKGGLGLAPSTVLVVVVIAVIVIALVIVGFFIFGVPRLNRRQRSAGTLFGEEDDRDSTTLRRAADRAAASGDYTTAIEEGFRSIARGLAERVVVITFPGTTAHGFAIEAASSFPKSREELGAAANAFDAVRYLGRTGTEAEWLAVSALERALRSSRPVFDEAVV